MIINDTLVNQLISNPVFKTDTRAIFFLLQNPEPVSADDIAAATGLSRKCANKATKRLTAAGLIIPGLPEARKRSFDVTGGEQIEPQEVTEGTTVEPSGTFTERFNRLESMIGALMDTLGAGLNPAHIHDGQNETGKVSLLSCVENSELINGQNGTEPGHNVTQAVTTPAPDGHNETRLMPVCSHVDQQENIKDTLCPESGQKRTIEEPSFIRQDKREPESIQKGTTTTEQGTNGPVTDPIVSELDDAITRAGARLAALKAASLLKEKAANSSFSSTCAPASIGEVFKGLFGFDVPPGFTDMAAVDTMVRRKQAGKLDNVKSPLAYLSALAGKIQPIVAAVSPPPPALPSVTENRMSHADMGRIDAIWDAMDHSQYKEKALAKDQIGKKYPVPVELLARSIFNAEMMAQGGIQ